MCDSYRCVRRPQQRQQLSDERSSRAAEPDDLAVWKHSRPARNPLGESPVRTCGGSVRDLQGERERERGVSRSARATLCLHLPAGGMTRGGGGGGKTGKEQERKAVLPQAVGRGILGLFSSPSVSLSSCSSLLVVIRQERAELCRCSRQEVEKAAPTLSPRQPHTPL